MDEIKLDVQTRAQYGSKKIKGIRRNSFIPAVIYGSEMKSTPVQVDRRAYERIMRSHKGKTVLFHLNLKEGDKRLSDYSVIIKEEQYDPVSDELTHIDFHRISMTQEIHVKVPIETKGDAPGVKKSGGSLDHLLWELDVICLPTNIPAKIEIDIAKLEIGDSVHVKDLVLPAGVKTKHDPESIVVTVAAPMKEEAIEAAAQVQTATAEVEVTKEKKLKPGEAAPAGKADEKAEAKPKAAEAKPAPEKK